VQILGRWGRRLQSIYPNKPVTSAATFSFYEKMNTVYLFVAHPQALLVSFRQLTKERPVWSMQEM